MDGTRKIFVFHDQREISNYLIKKWKYISGESIRKRGYFAVALSGGKTPLYFYSELAKPKKELPWDRTHIFLVDERHVPLSDSNSNYRMIKETLLNKINISKDNIHTIPAEESLPLDSAQKYEETLRNFFHIPKDEFPEFDLVILGIGEDGHTASLFPGSDVMGERNRLAVPVILDKPGYNRITLTLPVINKARYIIFLVTGKNKASIVKEVLEKGNTSLPASFIKQEKGKLIFVLDNEAGSHLSGAKR